MRNAPVIYIVVPCYNEEEVLPLTAEFLGKKLDDFNFNRNDFLDFIQYLKDECYNVYLSFLHSTKNSGTFKYTGLQNRIHPSVNAQPVLSDGKEIINQECGHSIIYKCYSDCDDCVLCDLKNFDEEVYL